MQQVVTFRANKDFDNKISAEDLVTSAANKWLDDNHLVFTAISASISITGNPGLSAVLTLLYTDGK
jgi:hypothetical protein